MGKNARSIFIPCFKIHRFTLLYSPGAPNDEIFTSHIAHEKLVRILVTAGRYTQHPKLSQDIASDKVIHRQGKGAIIGTSGNMGRFE